MQKKGIRRQSSDMLQIKFNGNICVSYVLPKIWGYILLILFERMAEES